MTEKKDPLNSAFLDGGVLHRTLAVCCRANRPPTAPSLVLLASVRLDVLKMPVDTPGYPAGVFVFQGMSSGPLFRR
jgi:hypothetical protein